MKASHFSRIIYFCAILMLIISFSSLLKSCDCYEIDDSGKVTYIVDGDTLDVNTVGRIRLADIDTPEIDESGGSEARIYLSSLVYPLTVYVDIDDVYGTDIYGRIVAVIYIQYNSTHVKNINKAMLVSGHAVIWNFQNEFNPYSWNLYEPYPPGSDPTPNPPPDDPPSDTNFIPNIIDPRIVISLSLAVGGIGSVAGVIIYKKIIKQKRISERIKSSPSTHSFMLIKDINPKSRNISVRGKVASIRSPHTFQKSNGLQGRVGSFIIEDATGTIRVVLWGDNNQFLDNKSVKLGSNVDLKGFYAKLNTFQGVTSLELHSSNHSHLAING